MKDKLIGLIERTFNREGPALHVKTETLFTPEKPKSIMHGLVKMYVMY